ncbi:hypothetical protein ACFWYW_58085 [Nonomuraea sp. NPDC059023]|uniref:hypothetical protein n=1 Tax=unclassified Nonomuraea TaxID=2593643 RepID=UPI0036925CA0
MHTLTRKRADPHPSLAGPFHPAALRELAERHDHATDLLQDVWSAAYKSDAKLRPRAQMEPGRAINHQVAAALVAAPEWGELRRETVGDSYAAAMAVLAQSAPLRAMLERTRGADVHRGNSANADLRQAQIAGLDLTHANMSDTDFARGVALLLAVARSL